MNLTSPATRRALRALFEKTFGPAPARVRCALAPGRVNLIGEHTDYSGGLVLPMAIDRHTAVLFRADGSRRVRVHAADLDAKGNDRDDAFAVDGAKIPRLSDPRRHWANYLRGTAQALRNRGLTLRGGELLATGDLPHGAGLSSSASLEVATGRALLALAGAKMPAQDLALAAQEAEHRYAGVRCGIMDQTVIACAKAGHALLLDCRSLKTRHVRLELKGWHFAIFDTGVRHSLAGSAYNRRRASCERAARQLRVPSLREATVEHLLARGGKLDAEDHRRARHVLGENLRVTQFAAALARGDLADLGVLLGQSHASLAGDYEVSCKELDFLARALQDAGSSVVAGARMTGGGFGGSVVALIRQGRFEKVRRALDGAYRRGPRKQGLGGALAVAPSAGARVAAL